MSAVPDVSGAISDWLSSIGLSARAEYTGYLVVEEMLTNIIKYGFDDAKPHTIHIRAILNVEFLRITIEDDGHPFDPTTVPSPNVEGLLESRKIGGLGIELVRRMTDRMQYERDGHINRLTLWIRRHSPADTQPIGIHIQTSKPQSSF